jgi:hypothetical protein
MSRGFHSPSNITTLVTGLRRKSHDVVGGEQGRTSPEPPAKRTRTESEATTVINPSTPRAATPGAVTSGPSGSTISAPRSLEVSHGLQRSNSDMILDSEDEASPPPQPDKGAADKRTDYNISFPPFKQQPFAIPQTEAVARVTQERQVPEETMPSIQDLSLAPPEVKPNPFTSFRILLHPPDALPPFVPSTTIPDLGHLSTRPSAVGHGPTNNPAADLQAPLQETPTHNTYTFSAAEIRTLVASRGSDEGSGPNKLEFFLDWDVLNGVVKWRNFKAGQG